MVTWQEARRIIEEAVRARSTPTAIESLPLEDALGRVLAETIHADRDYPPFRRATRDGYAVLSADLRKSPRTLSLAGEVRAGQSFARALRTGECIAIMTGAPVPEGADAVVMREFTRVDGEAIIFERTAAPGENIVLRGSESKAGQELLLPGTHLNYASLALAAQVGHTPVQVHERPRVAVLSTGDEVIPHADTPGPFQIRNSNSLALSLLAKISGAEPVALGNAPDERDALREGIEHGLEEDALILSGGVSMGKYDLVEEVLAVLGAEFFFDAVAIRPGKPAVFGYCQGKPVFGLPGNPLSTMVTFELFVQPALDILSGMDVRPLPFVGAKMARESKENPAMAHFVPALMTWEGDQPVVEELPWQGSGDMAAFTRANCLLYVPQGQSLVAEGQPVQVLLRRGAF